MDDRTVLVLNGPNLNLLGEREPEVYGSATLADVEALCLEAVERAGLVLDFRQSNHEGTLVDWVQEGRAGIAGLVVNAAGYTHTSVALRDALSACRVPRVEVHISDIHAREEFRHHSYLTDVCDHHVIGHGVQGYAEAIAWVGGAPCERDLPALWRSPEWRADIESWLLPALAAGRSHRHRSGRPGAGEVLVDRRCTSRPMPVGSGSRRTPRPRRSRPRWSTPSRGSSPDAVRAHSLAVDTERGWLATADLGLPLWHDETLPPVDDWVAVTAGVCRGSARAGRPRRRGARRPGVPPSPRQPDAVVGWVETWSTRSRALPEADPRRLDRRRGSAGRRRPPRIHDAAAALAEQRHPVHRCSTTTSTSATPSGDPGARSTYIDLGDALWAHPLTTSRIPMWIVRNRFDLDARTTSGSCGSLDAGLEPWTDRWDRETLRALLADGRPHLLPAPRRVVAPAPGRRAPAGRSTSLPAVGDRSGSSTPPPRTRTRPPSPAEPLRSRSQR